MPKKRTVYIDESALVVACHYCREGTHYQELFFIRVLRKEVCVTCVAAYYKWIESHESDFNVIDDDPDAKHALLVRLSLQFHGSCKPEEKPPMPSKRLKAFMATAPTRETVQDARGEINAEIFKLCRRVAKLHAKIAVWEGDMEFLYEHLLRIPAEPVPASAPPRSTKAKAIKTLRPQKKTSNPAAAVRETLDLSKLNAALAHAPVSLLKRSR